jgi:hypothetical protein
MDGFVRELARGVLPHVADRAAPAA